MKKIIYVIFFSPFLLSCATGKFIPFKNDYTKEPYKIESTKTKDQVWDNIIDLFAENGIGIRIIDRSSGLIISNEKALLTFTTEDKTGKILDPKAYVVAMRYYDPNSRKYYKPLRVTGEWNIRIKEIENRTLININLLNINAEYNMVSTNAAYFNTTYSKLEAKGYTTYEFEKLIANAIK